VREALPNLFSLLSRLESGPCKGIPQSLADRLSSVQCSEQKKRLTVDAPVVDEIFQTLSGILAAALSLVIILSLAGVLRGCRLVLTDKNNTSVSRSCGG
jgi:hypothetical protein